MPVTIMLENIDEAIIALGAVVASRKGAAPVVRKAAAEATTPAAPSDAAPSAPAAAPASTRKGRADKGQPRGPNARTQDAKLAAAAPDVAGDVKIITVTPLAWTEPNAGASSGPAMAEAAASAKPVEAAGVAGATPAAVDAPAPTQDVAQQALEKVFNFIASKPADQGGGNNAAIDAATNLLARYGVKKVRELPEGLRAKFVEHAESILAGGPI